MTRFVVTATLVLFSDQASGSIGLCSGSQFDPRKLRLVSVLLDSDRTMLANSKAMWLQLAPFGCHATEFMQIPKAARDLIHRPDDDFGLVVGYVVANHPLSMPVCVCGGLPGLDDVFRRRMLNRAVLPIAPPACRSEVKVAVSAFFLSFAYRIEFER